MVETESAVGGVELNLVHASGSASGSGSGSGLGYVAKVGQGTRGVPTRSHMPGHRGTVVSRHRFDSSGSGHALGLSVESPTGSPRVGDAAVFHDDEQANELDASASRPSDKQEIEGSSTAPNASTIISPVLTSGSMGMPRVQLPSVTE